MMEVLPSQEIEDRKYFLEQEADAIRSQLVGELESSLKRALDEMPAEIRGLSLQQFLALVSTATTKTSSGPANEPSAKRKKTILGLDSEDVLRFSQIQDPGRRLTRSMAAKMRQESFGGTEYRESNIFRVPSNTVPQTPKLFAGLPETPAAVRKQLKQLKGADPIRIAGSTIRATNIQSHPTRPTMSHRTADENRAPNPAVQNLIQMELSDGKIVDLDLTKSPGSVFTGIGREKAGEVKEWLSQYANAFSSFLKRLGS